MAIANTDLAWASILKELAKPLNITQCLRSSAP